MAAIVFVGLLLRVCNLGTFSLWLDEVLTMNFAALPLPKALAASASDAENVPVYIVVTHLARRIGLDEPWIRLPSILAGLVSIILLMVWTRRHFGASVGLLTGAFCAMSPFHIRYSQELRAYPYLLLITVLTLLAGDRLRRRPDALSTASLAATVALGCYTHLTYFLVLVPLVAVVLGGAENTRVHPARVVAGRLALAITAGVAAFLPWLFLITERLGERMVRHVREWTIDRLGERWQFLTVAPYETLDLDWLGFCFAGFAVVGLAAAFRYPAGRATLLAAFPTLVAWEIVLVNIRHWSVGRYDTALWPFVAVTIALGAHTILSLFRWRWLAVTAGIGLAAAVLIRVDVYHRLGRPRWHTVAQAIELVKRAREPVLSVGEWGRVCVGHYLESPIRSINNDARTILRELARRPSVLLLGGWPGSPEIRRLSRRQILLLDVHQAPRDASLYRITADFVDPDRLSPPRDTSKLIDWPEPAAELLPDDLGRPAKGCFQRLVPDAFGGFEPVVQSVRVHIYAASFSELGSGWSGLKTRSDDTTYRWVVGREASLELPRFETSSASLKLRLRPPSQLAGWQVVRSVINGHAIGSTQLSRGSQDITLDVPGSVWRPGRNLLVLQFRGALPNADAESAWKGPPPRAAAVDWLEIRPSESLD
jgi:hypothetical protein